MTRASSAEFRQLMALARGGDDAARGVVLSRYREYLQLLARLNLGQAMQAKVSRSDVVQDTFLQAAKNFSYFRGTTERELMAWLRRILATQIAQQVRFHHRGRRDIGIERAVADDIDRSSAGLGVQLIDSATSPSLRAEQHEHEVLLADALAQLKPDYREVIILRNLEGQSFDEVATRMGRSAAAVKSLWVRALATLRRSLGDRSAG